MNPVLITSINNRQRPDRRQRLTLGGRAAFGGLGAMRWRAHMPSAERVIKPHAVGGAAVVH